ncbi:transcriptional regulator, GntR family [Comamonas thiooxydans]|nr:transcriptional regulator, GntR family [Comamonas thiooxydans]
MDEMAARIATAIHEHRLLPGTKLGEDRLANIFNTSRARVREVLARMARDQMVELFPQRGAFVAKPSIEQALDVFEARRLIEPGIVRRLVLNMDNSKIRRLQTHLKQERDARANSDKRATVRLSGEFHVLLAELAGNSALLRSMRELSTLTCLTISLYESAVNTCCLVDEHEAVVDAIVAGNGELAEQLMLSHLDHIQGSLRLEADADDADLEQILGDL